MIAEPVAAAIAPFELTGNEVAFYEREGYLMLPGLLSEETAREVVGEVRAIMDVIGLGQSKLRQTTEYLPGSRLDSLVNDPTLRALAGQLMGGPATLYMPFTAVKSGNGGGTFHYHQDNQYTEFDGPGINFWFALGPMTPENGCLQVAPRSHRHGTLPVLPSGDGDQHRRAEWDPADFLPLRMRPGDCVAFSRLTVHGSGPNVTPQPRVAYAVQFHRDDVNARWAGGDWVRLKGHPRWPTAPVHAITPPQHASLDGH